MLGLSEHKHDRCHTDGARPPVHRRRVITFVVAAVGLEAAGLWRRGYGVGGNVVVRCRDGHVSTTIWIPGVSVKSIRLGWWRFQRCPVGAHWSLVTPVRRSELTEDEKRLAAERTDIRLP